MAHPLPRFAFALALLGTLLVPAGTVRAEDAAPADPEAPAAPARKETDDASIFKDWQLVKRRGEKHARGRAEFWTTKGAEGKDLMWVALMWDRAADPAKAIEVLEKFLEYKPPAENQKAVDGNKTNRETARKKLIENYTKNKDYAGAVKAAEAFREEFSESSVVGETWCDQGRAHRLAGDRDLAVAAFKQAAEARFVKGLLDLADVSLAEGDVAGAKAALEVISADDLKGKDELVKLYREFLDVYGTAAPSLETAANVGSGEAPKDWSKPTVLYYWAMTTANSDRRLTRLETLRRSYSDKIMAAGLATYNRFNPQSMKVEADMTDEAENEWYRKLILDSPVALPPMIVVPKAFLEAIKVKYEGQLVVVDGEGKLRYVRMSDRDAYDLQALELAIKKITGS